MNPFKLMACATVLTAIFASCSNDKTLTEPDKATLTKPADTAAQLGSSDAAQGNLQAQNLTLSIDPANGSVGVPKSQSTITVTFDEPMYRLGTEAEIKLFGTVQSPALVTRDLKTVAPVSYAWNADDSAVTITLGTALLDRERVRVAVPQGTPTQRPDSSADGHIGTKRLKQASFRAAQSGFAVLYAQAQGCVNSNNVVNLNDASTYVGDMAGNVYNRCFYGFDLNQTQAGGITPALPLNDILRFVGPTLYLHHGGAIGNPLPLGPELVEGVNYGFSIDAADFNTPNTTNDPAAILGDAGSNWQVAAIQKQLTKAWVDRASNGAQLHLRARFTNGSFGGAFPDGFLYNGIATADPTFKPQIYAYYETN